MPSAEADNRPPQPRDWMLFRFSLYGFLKNQQYYEPFLILAFRDKGLSFFQIGVLIAFREVCVNLMEVPSGAVADVCGRRRSMILSMAGYIASFALFGFGTVYWHFFPAMLLFAVGEAFRTGTHKAMIFDWVRQQGRDDERLKVYGFTRSWSKLGSALSALVAAALVFLTGSYHYIFWLSIPPYALNIVNFLGYPKSLDGEQKEGASVRSVCALLWRAAVQMVRVPALRGLVAESMMFGGTFKATKDYIQPLLKQTAIALPVLLAVSDEKRTALLVGVAFFLLYLGSSAASRNAYRIADRFGGEDGASRFLWVVALVGYAALGGMLWQDWVAVTLIVFVGFHIIQNFWRPVLVSRFNVHADADSTATVLSIESQAETLATMTIAPALGWCVDLAGFWPVGAFGAVAALLGMVACRVSCAPGATPDESTTTA